MAKEQKGKLKVMTLFGTRPEIIRLSRVLAKLDEYVHHVTVHTGQSYDYEMSEVFFRDLGVRKPDYFLGVKADTLGGQIANIIAKSEEVFLKEHPDALLILGDTNSALAAIVAKRMKIPIFHMEAGNRSFDENVPEETNRKIVDHISDINLPYSENARLYLMREGIHPGTIFVTGSPFAEILAHYAKNIDGSKVLEELSFKPKQYFVASIHREENVESKESLEKLVACLNAVAETYRMPIVVTTHPRTAQRLAEHKLTANPLVDFHKPFGYFDYVKLQKEAFCTISDSGTILEESSLLGFPAVQVRMSSERPEAYDEGVSILTGLDPNVVLAAIDIVTKEHAAGERYNVPRSYQDTNVSGKVLRHIVGLTGIVKRRRGNFI